MRTRSCLGVFAAMLCLSCGEEPLGHVPRDTPLPHIPADVPEPAPEPEPMVDPDPEALPLETTRWAGEYDCPWAQGKTTLVVTTTRDLETNLLDAIFAFSAHPENPTLPAGSWNMEGAYAPDTHGMHLFPTDWIVRPPRWRRVGMKGAYDASMQQIHGEIVLEDGSPNDLCDTFDLTRVQ